MNKIIITKILSDGTIVEVLEGGDERLVSVAPLRPMTEEEVNSAALSDPDSRPMLSDDLRKARRVSYVEKLRMSLNRT